ncbi:MAG TPA: nuclease-related domain-containing protein, partial [Xanthomonadales bacterium]|nr:nuclease-related domain-containing protein [Xanthomonadales bacterium]
MEYPSLLHWLWLLPLGLAALYVGSPRFLGTRSSQRLRKLLQASLDSRTMTLLHDLDLSVGGSVMHYDQLVLSRTGIHVIDALYLPGKVKGQRVQAWWQRQRFGRKHRFANPVHENFLRLQALQQALHLAPGCFHASVAISGHDSIETDARDVVLDVAAVAKKINSQSRPLLSAEELNQALLRIQQLQVHAPLLGAKSLRWR